MSIPMALVDYIPVVLFAAAAVVPAVYSGTMIFVTMMVLGVGCMCFGLAASLQLTKKEAAEA